MGLRTKRGLLTPSVIKSVDTLRATKRLDYLFGFATAQGLIRWRALPGSDLAGRGEEREAVGRQRGGAVECASVDGFYVMRLVCVL